MRNADLINLVFFSFFMMVAWLKKPQVPKRVIITVVGLAGVGITLLMHWAHFFFALKWASLLQNWLPGALLLLVYWLAGLFIGTPHLKFQESLEKYDNKIFGILIRSGLFRWIHFQLASYLEFSYFFCYLLIPFGMGVLYWAGLSRYSDFYWTNVELSTYLCFVLIPFAQTYPPRTMDVSHGFPLHSNRLRKINLWILKHGSIQLNTVPSSHVASTLSAALVLFGLNPVSGLVFGVISISIAVGAALGRYHYIVDVVLAMLLSCVVYLTSAFYFQL